MLLAIYLVRWAGVAPMQLGADHSEWGRAWRILNVQVNIFEASVLLVHRRSASHNCSNWCLCSVMVYELPPNKTW